ncbi:hypothetical protein EV379_3231 [Microterricola gilva]|uniref:Uncharacterized protein n=1 Tax=Microterricola gilva TaxID=393267 RepID=A0A4Q8ARK0_9MICO|nr:hypothetical protein EV379_3231 [Microterricola gilva]
MPTTLSGQPNPLGTNSTFRAATARNRVEVEAKL